MIVDLFAIDIYNIGFHRDSSHAEFLPRDSSHAIPPTGFLPRDSSHGIPPTWDSSHMGFLPHGIPLTGFLPHGITPTEYRVDKCIYFNTLLEQLTI